VNTREQIHRKDLAKVHCGGFISGFFLSDKQNTNFYILQLLCSKFHFGQR